MLLRAWLSRTSPEQVEQRIGPPGRSPEAPAWAPLTETPPQTFIYAKGYPTYTNVEVVNDPRPVGRVQTALPDLV